jgi:hypothetical protein
MSSAARRLFAPENILVGTSPDETELTFSIPKGDQIEMELPDPLCARAEELHAEAQKCQRLAQQTLDVVVREALIELASDYERQAERLSEQRG